MTEAVLLERRADHAIVTLNRPERLNAFDEGMHARLAEILAELADDPACRAVLLTGAGRGFCAGQDLAGQIPEDLGEAVERRYNPLVMRIVTMRKPVVCAVNGVAAGAGANLALACDLVIAAQSAKFIQSFAKIGLVPDSGGTWFLPRLAGTARALGMMLLAEPVPAEQAAQWGLVWQVVPDAELRPTAEALVARLATQATEGLALIKEAMRGSATNTLAQQLDLERDLQRRAGATADFHEGVRAFAEKRPARFEGR